MNRQSRACASTAVAPLAPVGCTTAADEPAPTLLAALVGRHHGRRRVLTDLVLPDRARVTVRLERWGQLLIERTTDVGAGRRQVRVPVPRDVLAGPARVVVTVVGSSGLVRETFLKTHVPAR
ncbi:hypothetical protein [Nocardioides sp. GY 10127]|uniref:hypothetical protein n=1 Tax=Nocardioides sp. GY 10127 TaxID=2569762 RepID=UPI0010A76CFE|nr:hypothetical protein [Nocardioides sp. GY 10127]TIC84352.1 hypothetical protein E8D37_06160 [Nocardioides sp. GY 10127]